MLRINRIKRLLFGDVGQAETAEAHLALAAQWYCVHAWDFLHPLELQRGKRAERTSITM
jgi:hypothetical protein